MSEFSLRGGSIARGLWSAFVTGIKYIGFPLLIITAFTVLFTQLGTTEMGEQLGLERLANYLVVLGIPITVLSFFRGFYPKGSLSRMIFGVVVAALICVWIWLLMMGGNLSIQFEEFGLTISFVGIVLLFILAATLGGIYYVVEMRSYRQEWLTSRESPQVRP